MKEFGTVSPQLPQGPWQHPGDLWYWVLPASFPESLSLAWSSSFLQAKERQDIITLAKCLVLGAHLLGWGYLRYIFFCPPPSHENA